MPEPTTKAPQLHVRMLAAARQLLTEPATPKRRREREARLAEIVAVGVTHGWNDAEGNLR